MVYFTGGIVSPFYFFYILPIIISAVFLKKRDTLYIATFSFIIFGILSDLMYLNVIPFYSEIYSPNISLSTFIYNLLMSFIAFSTVALFSSFYFDKIKKTDEELKNIQENLKDLVMINNIVMEKMENGFITCDAHGKIISYNETAKKLLHLNSKSNIFEILLSRHDIEELDKIYSSGKKYYFEKIVNKLILGISVSFIEKIYSFDKIFVIIITDLTEKKKIEEELGKKERFALIGEMAAGIAHEIRNPLASISGSVQFLKKKLDLEKESKNLMDIIVTESDRLSRSIEDFLDFTKVTPLKESKFDLSVVTDEVIELAKANTNKIKFVKKYNKNNMINGDIERIKQLIWNLVTNSVKSINDKGIIELNIYKQNSSIALSIKDNGVGMDKTEIEKIYTPFYSKFTSGIGLGMAIVRRIIEEHGYHIKLNSEKNIGTEVIVNFTGSQIE
jgi:two-component system sensor histidine kinase PilS (NtrC family)